MSRVWKEYLAEKKKLNEKIKVYLKSRTSSIKKVNSIMLSGFVNDFDEETLRLMDKECIIERSDVISIKPDNDYI